MDTIEGEDWIELDLSFEELWRWLADRLSALLFFQNDQLTVFDHEDHHWALDYDSRGRPCLLALRGYEQLMAVAIPGDQMEQVKMQPTDFGEVYALFGPEDALIGYLGFLDEAEWNDQWPERILAVRDQHLLS